VRGLGRPGKLVRDSRVSTHEAVQDESVALDEGELQACPGAERGKAFAGRVDQRAGITGRRGDRRACGATGHGMMIHGAFRHAGRAMTPDPAIFSPLGCGARC